MIVGALSVLDNVIKTDVYFQLGIITSDADDNKFSDCAFTANAHLLVSNDKHFNKLKKLTFPKITVVTLEEFAALLAGQA